MGSGYAAKPVLTGQNAVQALVQVLRDQQRQINRLKSRPAPVTASGST